MPTSDTVIVEFYGIPRQRAGQAQLAVQAGTVREVLMAVERSCPGLAGLVGADGRLPPQYLISLDGQRFLTESSETLQPGGRLLLLTADAGG
jgi:hypothetical protein